MTSIDETKLQKGLIITDDISPAPILDFDKYRNAIIKIIKESYPKFSIGIYGDWGSGKTTLMQSIYDKLKEENNNKKIPDIIPVWFNAWRYEREEHFTIIPLLKTIEYEIPSNYEILKKSLKESAIFGLKVSKDMISSIVGNYLGKEAGNLLKKGISDLTGRVIPNLEKLNELEKTTIYFEGQRKIEDEIKNIRKKNSDFRIIVFVDDLDRCSPEKVIEVFESIKIFLGLDGFIYILGISQNKISQAIKKKYEFDKIEEGDNYIKKIIQIPISLSEWDGVDVKILLQYFLDKKIIHEAYYDIIKENLDLISKAVESNPREVKRFLNNFIAAYGIFFLGNNKKANSEEAKNMLVIQAIQVRWNSFYHHLIKYGANFCIEIKMYMDLAHDERIKKLESEEKDEHFNYHFKLILRNYKSNTELWDFMKEQSKVLLNIKNWKQYRRAAESTKDISIKMKTINVTNDFLIQNSLPSEIILSLVVEAASSEITLIIHLIESIPIPKDNANLLKKSDSIQLLLSEFRESLPSKKEILSPSLPYITIDYEYRFSEIIKETDDYFDEILQLVKIEEMKDPELIISKIKDIKSKMITVKSRLEVIQNFLFKKYNKNSFGVSQI